MSFPGLSSLTITNGNDAAHEAYAAYCSEFLGYGPNLRALFAAADEMPECPLLNAHSAMLHLAYEGLEGWSNAAPFLTRMNQHLEGATEHEQLTAVAVNAWAARNFADCLDVLEQITQKWPQDLAAAKWGQYHAFNLGDHPAMLRIGNRVVKANRNAPYVHGLLAFALEQSHQIKAAECEARKATEIAIDDAWAHHALAHVMESEGRAADGAQWMDHCSHIWSSKGTFIREHNWWHTALFQLSLRNYKKVYEIFDTYLWGELPDFPQEQIGASSMLWRLELHGLSAGDRWQPVIEQARARTGENLFPFHDLHYLFALTQSGKAEDADKQLDTMRKRAECCCPRSADAWQRAGVPAAEGIVAFSRGDIETAATSLEKALPHLEKIGGSHAQRAVFHDTYIAAKQRLNDRDLALAE
jgi:hypothetical protein